MKSKSRKVGAEPGFAGGDPEVGHEGEPQAPADGSALHRGDGGFARREESDGFVVEVPARVTFQARTSSGEVCAGAEVLSFGAENDRPASGVCVEGFEGLTEGSDESDVEEIVGAPADLYRCYVFFSELDAYISKGSEFSHTFPWHPGLGGLKG